jgi:UDP-2,3-diacylglucosamine hydrolase
MSTLFISDLHLSPAQPDLAKILLHFLQTDAMQAEALYILGDLFDVWLGDDIVDPFYNDIFAALKRLSEKNIPSFFIAGNRDFLASTSFEKKTGCKILPDITLIDLYHTPTLLMHGDLLCTQDIAYQRFRKFTQNKLMRYLFLSCPKLWREKIGKHLRKKSQQYTSNTAQKIMDVTPGEAEKQLKKYHARLLIHGHTHRPAIHSLDNQLTRIVLPDWHIHGGVLRCFLNHTNELAWEIKTL